MAKQGTPTMGGIMFILGGGVTVFVLGWDAMLRGSLFICTCTCSR